MIDFLLDCGIDKDTLDILNKKYSTELFDLSCNKKEIVKIIKYLRDIGISSLYLLFDMHPYLLNKDAFEIRNYVNDRINRGELLEDIVDDIESNPYIIEE